MDLDGRSLIRPLIWHGRGRDERSDRLDEGLGPVVGDEAVAVAVADLDEASVRQDLGQAPSMLDRKETIFGCPHDENGTCEGAQTLDGAQSVSFVDCSYEALSVAANPAVTEVDA